MHAEYTEKHTKNAFAIRRKCKLEETTSVNQRQRMREKERDGPPYFLTNLLALLADVSHLRYTDGSSKSS